MKKQLLALGLFGAACGGSPAPLPETAGTPAERTSPTPTAATPPPAPAAVAPALRPESAPSPFHVMGELPEEAKLFGAGERGFVASQGGILYELAGDEVAHNPLLQRGFNDDPMFSLDAIGGRFPDAAWLATSHPYARSGFNKLWRWDGKRWVHKQSTNPSYFIAGIRPWMGGRLLAVEQAGMMFDASFRLLSGDKNIALPDFNRRKNYDSFCMTGLMVQAFETLPSGEVFIAGPRCNEDGTEGVAVARWAPGAKNVTMDELPGTRFEDESRANLTISGMVVRSRSDVYVAAVKDAWTEGTRDPVSSTYAAHFDGARWQEIPWKLADVVATLSTASDRTLLVTTDRGHLYTGDSIDTLAPVALPSELFRDGLEPKVTSLWSHAPGDLWAVVSLDAAGAKLAPRPTAPFYLLHTRPSTKPLPTVEEFEQKERAYRLPGPPVDWCTRPFVLLYTLGKKAPANYDYPATRAALKGKTEFAIEGVEFIEFERLGQRFFGARVPDFTLGKKLLSVVKEKVPGSTPELVCHDPPVLRTLAMDLGGGVVK